MTTVRLLARTVIGLLIVAIVGSVVLAVVVGPFFGVWEPLIGACIVLAIGGVAWIAFGPQ